MSDEGHRHEIGTLHGIGRRESDDWQRTVSRDISPEQWARFEANLSEIFQALGMEMTRPGPTRRRGAS